MKIGILGGTFNPIHIGHLILAEETREKLGLDKVVFVPAYLPPHKANGEIISASDRLAMVRQAIRGNRYLAVSDIEIKRKGKSYTIDTVREFKRKHPRDTLYFVIGGDLLNYLNEWKDLKDVTRLVRFIVATRPGYPLEKIPAYITTVSIRAVDISGVEVRRCIRERKSFRYLVPETVYRYITKKRLYK